VTSPTATHAPAGRDVGGIAQAFAVGAVLAGISALRLANRWPVALDISVFDQGLWKLATGRGAEVTVIGDTLFADHLSPVLVLFVPLYRLSASPYWLVVIQGFVVGLTVLPVRMIAAQNHLPRWIGTVAVATSAPILAAALFDFHPVTLAVPVIAWSVAAATIDDRRHLTIAILLIALIRADIVWVLAGVAVVAGPACRRRIAIMVPPILAVAVLAPSVLGTSRQRFDRIYATLGTGPFDAVIHPWRLLTTLTGQPALKTLVLWLLPVGFIVVLRWRWLLAVVIAGLPFLLSSVPGISEPWFYYGAIFTPVALGGAFAVFSDESLRRHHRAIAGCWVTGALLALLFTSPLAAGAPSSLRLSSVIMPREVAGWDEAIRRIGPDESLAADFDLLAPLAHRNQAFIYPCPFEDFPNEEVCARSVDSPPKIDVVLTRANRRAELEQRGFRIEEIPGSELILGRS